MGLPTTRSILGPTLGQIQLSIQQRVACLTGIGQQDAQLTVLDTPGRPTVLPLHSHRLAALLEKARFIDHQDSTAICKLLAFRRCTALLATARCPTPLDPRGIASHTVSFLLPPPPIASHFCVQSDSAILADTP